MRPLTGGRSSRTGAPAGHRRSGAHRRSQWILMGLVMLLTPPTHAIVEKIDVITPRHYGYVVGDLLEYEIRVSLESPYRIDADSLPPAGRIDRWLWLRAPEISVRQSTTSTMYRIGLVYQLLSAPSQVTQLFIPEQTLYFSDGKERLPLFLKPWGFTAGPLLEPDPDGLAYTDIQPAIPPPPVPTASYWAGMASSAAVLLAGLGALAYIFWAIPLLNRSSGPFARAYRSVSRLRDDHVPAHYDKALRTLHRAFNETAGSTVFLETLTDFFRAQPQFGRLRGDIEGFFQESRAQFFGTPLPRPVSDLNALKRLCRACRDVERGLA